MGLRGFIKLFAVFGTLLALFSNLFIYTYPSIHPGRCSWARTKNDKFVDVSLPKGLSTTNKVKITVQNYFNDLFGYTENTEDSAVEDIHFMAFGDPQIKGIFKNTPYNTRLDIFGNDYYLGHIYSMMKKRLKPSHVAVLGDLFSSQWIGDSEFYNRTYRYMDRIFQRDTTEIVNIKENHHDEEGQYKTDWKAWGDQFKEYYENNMTFPFGYSDVYSWNPNQENFLFINISGNHDCGYSGDATYQHMSRYYDMFGKDNYWIEYDTNTDHPWRIVVLNSLLLDGPPLQQEFVDATWEFLYQLFERRFEGNTILLSHVPFYKEEGLCVDGPEFRYYPEVFEREPYKANLLRSQNHQSKETSEKVLNLVFDNDKPGIVLTGHDHEGCETIYNKFKNGTWEATRKPVYEDTLAHIQEVTVRAMMGEFYGNTGLITGHFNKSLKTWEWKFSLCPFAIQHVWWIAKVSALISGFLWSFIVLLN